MKWHSLPIILLVKTYHSEVKFLKSLFIYSICTWLNCTSITSFYYIKPQSISAYSVYSRLNAFCCISFLQAVLLLVSAVLYCFGQDEFLAFLVLSLALSWVNLLYFFRGSKHMGIYSIMIQKVRDIYLSYPASFTLVFRVGY